MKKIMRLIIFMFVFTLVFFRVRTVLVYDNNTYWKVRARNHQILSDEFENVDALFVGGSRMQVGVSPIILWQETGIVSYNLATNTQPPLMTRLILERFVDEVQPSVVFMDLPGIVREADPSNKSDTNNYVIAFQLMDSREHKKGAIDILSERYPDFDARIFRYPFYKDHSRWRMLSRGDFVDASNYHSFLMGGVNEQAMREPDLRIKNRTYVEKHSAEYEFNKHAYEDYLSIIETLRSKNIDVILVSPPFAMNMNNESLHAITDFAKKHNLMFFDYNLTKNFDRINFREKNDFYDNGHLSITGAKKFTKILSHDIKPYVKVKEKTPEEENKLKNYLDAYNNYYQERAKAFE